MTITIEKTDLERALEFFVQIGLPAVVRPGATGFIPGVEIVEGVLHIDPGAPVSGVLHEASHVALVPGRFRRLLSGDIGKGVKKMFREVESMDLEPDSIFERALINCSDPEATAWAWAAGVAIGLPPERIILDNEYDNDGESIRLSLQMNAYVGINGMQHGGMCVIRSRNGQPAYPNMLRWLQID